MTLEEQLAILAKFGLPLDEGVTVDDLIYSFDRVGYEDPPFHLILYVLGFHVERDPWDRPVCSRTWNFETESIRVTGDYVAIVRSLCNLAGNKNHLTNLVDHVDIKSGDAWLQYRTADGVDRGWKLEVDENMADMLTIAYVMDDIERDGKRFYFKDNGVAKIMYYLDEATAAELNRLSRGALLEMSFR